MEGQRHDWSDGPRYPGEEPEYDQFHLSVGQVSYDLLAVLSLPIDLVDMQAEWTRPDSKVLTYLEYIEGDVPWMVPPERTPIANRDRAVDLFRSFHDALPFTEGELKWLLKVRDRHEGFGKGPSLGAVADQQAELVLGGVRRTVTTRDLLQRLGRWRREYGEYAGGEGVAQARESLAGLVELLTPDLGLPAEYRALPGAD